MPYITPRNITTNYKEDKKFGKLIRSQRFEVSSDEGKTNLKFRITYLKPSEEYPFDININLKVSGQNQVKILPPSVIVHVVVITILEVRLDMN